jgi:hypothetical protein
MIKHLLFECLAKVVCSIIQLAPSGLSQPHSVTHMFGSWLRGIGTYLRTLLLLGATTTGWSYGCVEMIWSLIKKNQCSFAGCLLDYPLASYLGYFLRSCIHGIWS